MLIDQGNYYTSAFITLDHWDMGVGNKNHIRLDKITSRYVRLAREKEITYQIRLG